jgi:hypothetical protein
MKFTKTLMRCVQIEATKHCEGIVTHHDGILRSRMLMFNSMSCSMELEANIKGAMFKQIS